MLVNWRLVFKMAPASGMKMTTKEGKAAVLALVEATAAVHLHRILQAEHQIMWSAEVIVEAGQLQVLQTVMVIQPL